MIIEQKRRETHLLSGIGVQLVVITLLVFTYTQAARQLNRQREFYLRMQEQLVSSQKEIEMKGKPDVSALEVQISHIQDVLPTMEALSGWAQEVEALARDRFGFKDISVEVGPLEKIVSRKVGKESIEIPLYAVELKGIATTRNISDLLAALDQGRTNILSTLEEMKISASDLEQPTPIVVQLRWLTATSPTGKWKPSR